MAPESAALCWSALGSGVTLVVDDQGALAPAERIVRELLDDVDRTCSRFREDSDLSRVNAAGGATVQVDELLVAALAVALRAARLTDGAVDPTLGAELVLSGYDRDWDVMVRDDGDAAPAGASRLRLLRRGDYRAIELDERACTVTVPRGMALDLGATAKAWAADRCAQAVHAATGAAVIISLGGDISCAGRLPPDGWPVRVCEDHRAGPGAPGQEIALHGGGLATSSITVRRWRHRGDAMHHILDPHSGIPVRGRWRTVTVAAADCVDANSASTAALVRQHDAPAWLAGMGLPARLVDRTGAVTTVGGWPTVAGEPPGAA